MSHKVFRVSLAILIACAALFTNVGTAHANISITCRDGKIEISLVDFPKSQQFQVNINGQNVGAINLDGAGNGFFAGNAPPGASQITAAQLTGPMTLNLLRPGQVIPCQTSKPKGPEGNQGQTTSSSVNTKGNAPNSGNKGDPISTSTGEYYFDLPLIDLGGSIPLTFSLTYAANLDKSAASHNDPFGGNNFSHNFHVALKQTGESSLVIFFGSGNLINFQKIEGGWQVKGEETAYALSESSARYYLLDPISQIIFTFDKAKSGNDNIGVLKRIEDRNGNALVFTTDGVGRVNRVDDGKGRSLIFTYADPSDTWTWAHLAQVSDGNNRAIKFEYKSTTEPLTTHLISVTDPLKQTTKFTHEGAITNTVVSAITYPLGNTPYTNKYEVSSGQWVVTSQTDAFGNTTQLKIDKGVATMTDPLGNVTQHTHKESRLLSDMKDVSNKNASLAYDDQGRRTEIRDRLGGTTKIAYHPQTGSIASVTNAKGETISYVYAAQEQIIGEAKFTFYNLTKVDYPDKTSAKFDYDARGNLITYTDPAAQVWKFTYTPTGLPSTVTNPANPALSGAEGGVVTYTYNFDQTLASRKDSETGETRFTYDAFKRVTKITYADRTETAFTYNANDQLTSITDPLKGVTKFEYDANGNLIKTTDAAGKERTYAYDKMDRLIKTTNRLGQSSSLAYDKLGRVESTTDATGVMAQFAYDPRGWLNQIKLGESAWKYGYDDEGVINSLTSPSGNTTKIQSDKIGLPSSTVNALNQTSSLTRDASNRITKVTDPLKRDTSYAYDARGALNGVTAPVVGSSKYEYDAAGNLTKITDLNGAEWKFTYSPMGRLLTKTDPLGKATQYKYDERGRLSLVTYPDNTTRATAYDALGNIARVTFSDKSEKKFVYDALGRLIEADGVKFSRDAEGRITQTSEVGSLNGASYDNAGRVKTVSYNNNATSTSLSASFAVTYVYDEKTGLLKQVTDSLTKTQIDFTYDKDLRLTNIARSNKVNTSLTWDNVNRLIGIRDGEVSNLQYTLDDAGQVTQLSGKLPLDPSPNLQSQISNLQYNNASQLTTAGYSYDAQGRLTASPTNKFAWDADSQLVGIDSVKLSYNGLGEVISREEGGKVTRFAYNYALGLAPIVAEMQDTKPLRYYVWTPGGALLYAIDASDGNKVSHYHFDRTGSTLALTDADGKMTDAYAYDPYGKVLMHDGKKTQPFTFVGKWGVRQESPTLYQMRARYYDATMQRFLSPELLWPQIDEPQLLNLYGYAYNNPLKYVDVDGLTPLEVMEYFQSLEEFQPFGGTPAEKAAVKNIMSNFLNKEAPQLIANKEAAMKAAAEEAARLERARIAQALASVNKLKATASVAARLGRAGATAGLSLLAEVLAEWYWIGAGEATGFNKIAQRHFELERKRQAEQEEYERRKAEYEKWKAQQELLRLIDLAKREAEFKLWQIEQKEQARVNALLREGKGGVMLGGVPPEHIGSNETVIAKQPR